MFSFLVTVLSGMLPQRFKKLNNSQNLLGIANTFSGGVFLAIAFVHIIPETATNYYMYVLIKNEILSQQNYQPPPVKYKLEDGVSKPV